MDEFGEEEFIAAGAELLGYGMAYRFYGHTVPYNNRRTGKTEDQFKFESFVAEKPATLQAVVAYLQQCDGIGPVTARTMFEIKGAEAVTWLREKPAEVAAQVPRLKLDKAQAAAVLLGKMQATERAKMDLLGLLNGRSLPKKTVDHAISDYGSAAAQHIRRNPYLLMKYKGIGFLKADQLYLELGPKGGPDRAKHAARIKRQALCCWYAIARESTGDTWFSANVAKRALSQSIAGAQPDFQRAITLAIRSGMLAERYENGSRLLAEQKKAAAEDRVARSLAWAAEESEAADRFEGWPEVTEEFGLSPHQVVNVRNATSGIIGILAGSPGTGKTYCSAAIIRAAIALFGMDKIAVAAPTGKAAVRVTEAMQRNGVNLKAVTIHSLLQVESSADGWSFRYGRANPLPFQFVIIDEASMIDTDLMASLLAARGRGTFFLFVGDPNQLAPVGHGAPLRDMIAAGIPCGTLTEIQRNSGRIVRACAEIRDTRKFAVSPALDLEAGENLIVVEQDTPERQISSLEQIIGQFINANPRRYDPVWDVQVLVAVNKKSPLGRKPLNTALQQLLNASGERAAGNPFRIGDKVINLKNGWLPSLEKTELANEDGKVYVANGEQGEVLQVETNKTVIRLMNPDRLVLVPRGTQDDKSDDEPDKGNPEDEENSENQSTGTGCNWDLGYAISVHKFQGSECPIVIVVIDEHNSARRVCSRNWLYTALSRAKTACLLIGKKTVANDFCRQDGLRRRTYLVERFTELRKPTAIQIPAPALPQNVISSLLVGVL